MKKIKLSLACLSISLLLVSCGSKNGESNGAEPAPVQDPKAFYKEVTLRVDNCDNAYFAFSESLYAEDKKDIAPSYDAMIKTFEEEQKQIAKIDVAAGGADQTLSKNFKDAAAKYIDVYVECGKNEMLQLKNLAIAGKTDEDAEVIAADEALTDKTSEVTMPFVKLRKEFREKNGIEKF